MLICSIWTIYDDSVFCEHEPTARLDSDTRCFGNGDMLACMNKLFEIKDLIEKGPYETDRHVSPLGMGT